MPRLLIIDDDAHVRGLVPKLCYNLVGSALEVVSASDLSEALAICRAGAVDVALCDYFMQDLDGPEVLRRLKASFPRLRGLLITGDAGLVGQTLPECERPVRDKAELGEAVAEAVELAMEGL